MTGRQDDRQDDRQRILDEYMIDPESDPMFVIMNNIALVLSILENLVM